MSRVCLARRPCGVLISIGVPYAASTGGASTFEQPASATTTETATVSASARRALRLPLVSGTCNVEDDLELEQ